jgi:hypothetical protein
VEQKTELQVEEPAACKQQYRAVEQCMEQYGGSISACNK